MVTPPNDEWDAVSPRETELYAELRNILINFAMRRGLSLAELFGFMALFMSSIGVQATTAREDDDG
jgi:hypothetical protein